MNLREIDAQVAERIFGCKVAKILDYGVEGNYRYRCDCNGPSPIGSPPHTRDSFDNDIMNYSSDISAAWEVVEKMRHKWWIDVMAKGELYEVQFESHGHISTRTNLSVFEDSAPLAICKCALAALEAIEPDKT